MIYVGRRYTSRATASVRKSVSCEKCRAAYTYLATRQGVGQGVSPYMLNNAGAASRAQEAARRSLDAKLRDACEVVPCPRCGWIQAPMVVEARRRRLRWMLIAGIILPILVLVPYGLVAAMMSGDVTDETLFALMLGAVGFSLIPARGLLNSCCDPNAKRRA